MGGSGRSCWVREVRDQCRSLVRKGGPRNYQRSTPLPVTRGFVSETMIHHGLGNIHVIGQMNIAHACSRNVHVISAHGAMLIALDRTGRQTQAHDSVHMFQFPPHGAVVLQLHFNAAAQQTGQHCTQCFVNAIWFSRMLSHVAILSLGLALAPFRPSRICPSVLKKKNETFVARRVADVHQGCVKSVSIMASLLHAMAEAFQAGFRLHKMLVLFNNKISLTLHHRGN